MEYLDGDRAVASVVERPLVMKLLSILVPTALVVVAAAAPTKRASPAVTLDDGTFIGVADGQVNKWLGIPFAKPPCVLHLKPQSFQLADTGTPRRVGDLRFGLPVPVDPYTGSTQTTSFGAACPQQDIDLPLINGLAGDAIDFIVNTIYGAVFPDDEDCV